MIIVSQDKKHILNFDNAHSLDIGEKIINNDREKNSTIEAFLGDNKYVLGYFKTEERAKEVLIAIGAYYGLCEIYKYGEQGDRDKINDFAAKRGVEPFIFPMPEE